MGSEMPEVKARMEDVNTQSALMGQLLLKGWRMLDRSDIGGCPLMQDPETAREFSVSAGKFVDEIQNDAQTVSKAPEPLPVTLPAQSPLRYQDRYPVKAQQKAGDNVGELAIPQPSSSSSTNIRTSDEQSA